MAKKQTPKNAPIGLDVQLNKSEAFIEKHLKQILIAVAAVVVVVAGVFIYRNYMQSQDLEAATAISASQRAFAQEQYEQALNGDGVQEKGFLKIISEYSGTPTANLAKAYAGICYANLDMIDEAIKMLESFSPKSDIILSPAAVAALGNCYVKKGDNEKGASTLLKAAKMADNDAMSPIFLLQAGEVYEEMGKKAEAVKLYEEIKTKYFRSPINNDIEKYIERAKE